MCPSRISPLLKGKEIIRKRKWGQEWDGGNSSFWDDGLDNAIRLLPLNLPTAKNEIEEICFGIMQSKTLRLFLGLWDSPWLCSPGAPCGCLSLVSWLLPGEGWRNNHIIIINSKTFSSWLIFNCFRAYSDLSVLGVAFLHTLVGWEPPSQARLFWATLITFVSELCSSKMHHSDW